MSLRPALWGPGAAPQAVASNSVLFRPGVNTVNYDPYGTLQQSRMAALEDSSGMGTAVMAGVLQGGANSINGAQDGVVGTVNLIPLAINKLEGNHVPYLPSPDWSRNKFSSESDWTHDKSKLVGGTGVLTAATAGLGAGAAGTGAAASQTGTIVVQAEGRLAVAAAGMAVAPATAAAAAGMGVGAIGQTVQMSAGNAGGSGPNAGPAVPRTGDLFERTFQTPKGPVGFLAETAVEGDTLILKDVVVYGEGTTPLTDLTREAFAARTQLIEEAKALGFKKLRITGQRVQTSSSGNPGHVIDITIDLTK